MRITGNNSAYPARYSNYTDAGMDIRTYLSGIAMEGILAAAITDIHLHNSDIPNVKEVAKLAVKMADALIEELNKEEKP